MTARNRGGEPAADPFGERGTAAFRASAQVLGGEFNFEAGTRDLMRLVKQAFGRLPAHKLPGAGRPFKVKLVMSGARASPELPPQPPAVKPVGGSAILGGVVESGSFVAVTVTDREALVVVSPDMLRFPYHVRYELLEFSVYTLAARAQGLVPLHAACVGAGGRGALLLGSSGAGKSTLSLSCLLQGLDFVAEDSVLVRPRGLLATGLGNFLHIRTDSLQLLPSAGAAARAIRQSPVIRRRSGVEKLEIDLRRPQFQLAPKPLPLAAVIVVAARSATGGSLLMPLRRAHIIEELTKGQRYAVNQPGWKDFIRRVARLPAFELHRGDTPADSAAALSELLA
jgi:hypothetical protein